MPMSSPSVPEALAAVGILARIGVSDEALGRAVREWLAKAQDAEPTSSHPTLGSGALSASRPVQAPRTPIDEGTAAASASSSLTVASSRGIETGVVPLKVRFGGGSATNITIPTTLLVQLATKLGSEAAARAAARDCAKKAPLDAKNRSAWVVAALISQIAG
jgi:hypothetical protein